MQDLTIPSPYASWQTLADIGEAQDAAARAAGFQPEASEEQDLELGA